MPSRLAVGFERPDLVEPTPACSTALRKEAIGRGEEGPLQHRADNEAEAHRRRDREMDQNQSCNFHDRFFAQSRYG